MEIKWVCWELIRVLSRSEASQASAWFLPHIKSVPRKGVYKVLPLSSSKFPLSHFPRSFTYIIIMLFKCTNQNLFKALAAHTLQQYEPVRLNRHSSDFCHCLPDAFWVQAQAEKNILSHAPSTFLTYGLTFKFLSALQVLAGSGLCLKPLFSEEIHLPVDK